MGETNVGPSGAYRYVTNCVSGSVGGGSFYDDSWGRTFFWIKLLGRAVDNFVGNKFPIPRGMQTKAG